MVRRFTNYLSATALFFFSSLSVMAAEVASSPDATAADGTLQQIIEDGGLTLKAILILSAIMVFLVIYYLLTIRNGVICPDKFIKEAENAAAVCDVEALCAISENNDSAAAQIIGAAAEHMTGHPDKDYFAVKEALEDEGGRQANSLWQKIQYLMDLATIAPMVGLLGTVIGMLKSFAGLKVDTAGVIPTKMAQGVSQAMITTAAGLIVGIVAMALYALFRGRVNSQISKLESACSRVLRQSLKTK